MVMLFVNEILDFVCFVFGIGVWTSAHQVFVKIT